MLQKTKKELAEMKRQLISMGWNDKIVELDKSIESGELMIVETKERQKHIHFCGDSKNVEQYRVSESEVAKVVRVERRVKEFTINAKSVTVYFDKDGKKLEVPSKVDEILDTIKKEVEK